MAVAAFAGTDRAASVSPISRMAAFFVLAQGFHWMKAATEIGHFLRGLWTE